MITKPSLTVPAWADSGDMIQPDTSYIASGFPRTNDKPTRQTMNFALNYAWNGVQYLVSRGIPEWDATQSYAAGDVVRASGKFYSATSAANNVNRNPPSSPTFWMLWYVFAADLNTLYITAAQVASVYLPRTEAATVYATTTTLNATRDNLQNQINSIVTITGRGYFPGAGISINSENVIANTAPNVNADWNAATGTPGHIFNKPTFAAVATSGLYNDLTGRPVLAPVATSGRWQDLTEIPSLPPPQVNSDWNATSGVAQILNKPDLPQITTDVNGVLYANAYRCRTGGVGGSFSGNNYFNIAWQGGAVHIWIDVTDMVVLQPNFSDYRLKQNVEPITDALPLVMRLRPITFNWMGYLADNHATHAGFLAHEVQEVFAGAAEGMKDELTANGAIQPQHLNDRDIIALLTRAVQELADNVSRLESKMNDIVPELN